MPLLIFTVNEEGISSFLAAADAGEFPKKRLPAQSVPVPSSSFLIDKGELDGGRGRT